MSLFCLSPMQALGHVSYSWYLWHWPVLVLGAAVYVNASLAARIALALFALLLAWVSFYCVERPIRRQDALLRRPALTAAGVMTILVAGGLLCRLWFPLIESRLSSPEYQKIMTAEQDLSEIYGMGCDTWYKSANVTLCAFGDEGAPRSAVLLADSVGAQWFPALKQRFTQPGWNLLVITKSSCPIIDKPIFYARIGRDYTECTRWREAALEWLQTRRTDILLLGSAHDYAVTPKDWTEGTQKILQAIRPHAKDIVLIRGTPTLPFNALSCLAGNNRLTRFLAGDDRCRAPSANAENETVYLALQTAAALFDNVRMLDMNDAVCPGGTCYAKRDGDIVFRDGRHLTARFVEHLGDEFVRRLEAPSDHARQIGQD